MEEQTQHLTERQLNFGYWYITNKPLLERLGHIVLWAIIVVCIAIGTVQLVDWFSVNGRVERMRLLGMFGSRVNFSAFNQVNAPRDISAGDAGYLAGKNGTDYFVPVKNPSAMWIAHLTVTFSAQGFVTKPVTVTLLPGEERHVMSLNNASGPALVPSLVTKALVWEHVPSHAVLQYDRWAAERLDIRATDVRSDGVEFMGKKALRTSFKVTNATAFSYYHVPLQVILKRGESTVAVQNSVLDMLRSGDRRLVELFWFDDIPPFTSIVVRPELNLFDPKIYIPANNRPSTDIRDQRIVN